MCSDIFDHENALSSYRIEPFTNREAWKWLLTQASQAMHYGEIIVSIRSLAKIWRWHKSKVERFIKLLKSKSLIETSTETGKTCISICNLITFDNYEPSFKTSNETATARKLNSSNKYFIKRGTFETGTKPHKGRQLRALEANPQNTIETKSRQNREALFFKKKKEKNQKKEKEEDLKEKNIPYGDIKKENIWEYFHDQLHALPSTDMIKFAASIGVDLNRLNWELEKFKDYFADTRRKPPRNAIATFRNWLRRSIEFNRFRGKDEKFNQAKSASNSFKRFVVATARAATELERDRLDRKYDRDESIFMP